MTFVRILNKKAAGLLLTVTVMIFGSVANANDYSIWAGGVIHSVSQFSEDSQYYYFFVPELSDQIVGECSIGGKAYNLSVKKNEGIGVNARNQAFVALLKMAATAPDAELQIMAAAFGTQIDPENNASVQLACIQDTDGNMVPWAYPTIIWIGRR